MANDKAQPDGMKKEEFLQHWGQLAARQPIRPAPVPYKHAGSTYQEDGIRITGSRAFVDSVLSHLQELLGYEAAGTRLQVVYRQSTDKETGRPVDSWNCYIQVHERGREAAMINSAFGLFSR